MSSRLSNSISYTKPRSLSGKGTFRKTPQSSLIQRSDDPFAFAPLQELDQEDLQGVRNMFPRVHEALCQYDRMLHHSEERFKAKEAELLRCINVGQELLDELDQLKDRCNALINERDALMRHNNNLSSSPNIEKALEKERKYWTKRQSEWESREEKANVDLNKARDELRERDNQFRQLEDNFAEQQRKLHSEIQRLKDEVADQQLDLQRREHELRNAQLELRDLSVVTSEANLSLGNKTNQLAVAIRQPERFPVTADLLAAVHMSVTVVNQLLQLKEEVSPISKNFVSLDKASFTRLKAPVERREEASQGFYLDWLLEALRKESEIVSDIFSQWEEVKYVNRQTQQNCDILQQQKEDLESTLSKLNENYKIVVNELHSSKDLAKKRDNELEIEREKESRRSSQEVSKLRSKINELESENTILKQNELQLKREFDLNKEVVKSEAKMEIEKLQRALRRQEEELRLRDRTKSTVAPYITRSENAAEVNHYISGHIDGNEKLKAEIKELEDLLREQREQCSKLREELRNKEDDIHSLKENAKESLENASEENQLLVQKLRDENQNLRETVRKMHEDSQRELDQIHQSKTQLMQEIRELTESLSNVNDEIIPELQKENSEVQRRLASTLEDLKNSNHELDRKEEEIKSLRAKVEKMNKGKSELIETASVAQQRQNEIKLLQTRIKEAEATVEEKELELQDLRQCVLSTNNAMKSIKQQNKLLNDKLQSYSNESTDSQSRMEKRLTALLQENQQLTDERAEFLQTIQRQEAQHQATASELQVAKDELETAQKRRRKVERLLVDAPVSTSAWDALCVSLRDGMNRLQEEQERHGCGDGAKVGGEILEILLAECASYVEEQSDKLSRAWESVRKKVLNSYALEDEESPRLSQSTALSDAGSYTTTQSNPPNNLVEDDKNGIGSEARVSSCISKSVVDLCALIENLEKKEIDARKALAENTGHDEDLEDAKRRIQRFEADLKAARENTEVHKGAAATAEAELERQQRRTEELREELSQLDEAYKEAVSQGARLEERLAVKTRELETEKIKHQSQIDHLNFKLEQVTESGLHEAKAQRQLQDAEARVRSARDTIDTLNFKIGQLEKDNELLAAREREWRSHEAESREEAARLRQALQALKSETETLQLIMEQKDADGAERTHQQLEEMRAHMQQQLKETKQNLVVAKNASEGWKQQVEQLQQETTFLNSKLKAMQNERLLIEKSVMAERTELEALRRVNQTLEKRLSEVEGDRDPLRQQLHSLLSSTQ